MPAFTPRARGGGGGRDGPRALTDLPGSTRLWTRIDHELTNRAVWLPLVNPRLLDFVSSRVRNYEFHPIWGFIADQVWLR